MVRIGNFLFRYRNGLFPLFYLTLLIPSPKLFDGFGVPIFLGLGIVFLGQGIRVLTIGMTNILRGGSKGKVFAKKLVTEGMFAHSRNPLYTGNILALLGLGIMANSVYFLCCTFPLFLFFYQAIITSEESYLRREFGEEYQTYIRSVPRWFPNLSGLIGTLRSMRFSWKRVIIREYNTLFISIVAAVILIMKDMYTISGRTTFHRMLPFSLGILIFLTICYMTVWHLKKKKIIRAD